MMLRFLTTYRNDIVFLKDHSVISTERNDEKSNCKLSKFLICV